MDAPILDAPILVSVVTGFLGAGKSSLLEHWLTQLPRDETAVIVNEQGEVGIDGSLLAHRAARLREITGGCICCVTQAALDAALVELAEASPPPTRILVETSGAASPAGVIRALTGGCARDRLRLDGVITVIDAHRAQRTLKVALTIEQLAFADLVLMSHVDLCTEQVCVALEDQLSNYAPGAVVARANRGRLENSPASSLLELLAMRSEVLRPLPGVVDSVPRHGFDAVSLVHDGELDDERFGDWVEQALGPIEARIARVKGILAMQGVDERVIVQGVSAAVEVQLGMPWGDDQRTSRLVVIGLGLDAPQLRAGFMACVTDALGS